MKTFRAAVIAYANNELILAFIESHKKYVN